MESFSLKDAKRYLIQNGIRKRDAMDRMTHMTGSERISYIKSLGGTSSPRRRMRPSPPGECYNCRWSDACQTTGVCYIQIKRRKGQLSITV